MSYEDDSYSEPEKPSASMNWMGKVLQKFSWGWQTTHKITQDNGYQLVTKDHIEQVERKLYDEGLKETHAIVLPEKNQLQVDIDFEKIPAATEKAIQILVKAMDGPVGLTRYRSRHGRLHLVFDLPKEVTDIERIAWQAALGSDPVREAMCLMALAKNIKNGCLLIQRKDGTDKIDHQLFEPTVRKFR